MLSVKQRQAAAAVYVVMKSLPGQGGVQLKKTRVGDRLHPGCILTSVKQCSLTFHTISLGQKPAGVAQIACPPERGRMATRFFLRLRTAERSQDSITAIAAGERKVAEQFRNVLRRRSGFDNPCG